MKIVNLRNFPRRLIPLAIFDLTLRCFAAWKAVQNKHYGWLAAIIVVNSAGILPLVYLLRFQKKNEASA